MKHTETASTKTNTGTRAPVQKFGTLDPELWAKFQAWCEARGTKTSAFIERFITDVTQGRYVHLQQLKSEAVVELERTADEQASTLDLLVSRILSEWCAAKMAERKKGKK